MPTREQDVSYSSARGRCFTVILVMDMSVCVYVCVYAPCTHVYVRMLVSAWVCVRVQCIDIPVHVCICICVCWHMFLAVPRARTQV